MTARVLCYVKHCPYVAESQLADFKVCGLHDSPKVLAILEDLRMPTITWPKEPFLVFPGFALCEDDFVPRTAPEGATLAEDCPKLAEIVAQAMTEAAIKVRSASVQLQYDLFAEEP